MAENENIVVNQTPSEEQKPSFLKRAGAGLKEWWRKQIVTLKRFPQRIPLIITVITSVLWLLWLFTFSRSAYEVSGVNVLGLIIFVSTLLSILVLPLFLNAFPKRSKPNIAFIVLVFVFFAALVALDVVYYMLSYDFLYVQGGQDEAWIAARPYIGQSFTYAIVHIVFVALSAISLALLPVYTPLIRKINTSKEVEGNDIHENIDVEDE